MLKKAKVEVEPSDCDKVGDTSCDMQMTKREKLDERKFKEVSGQHLENRTEELEPIQKMKDEDSLHFENKLGISESHTGNSQDLIPYISHSRFAANICVATITTNTSSYNTFAHATKSLHLKRVHRKELASEKFSPVLNSQDCRLLSFESHSAQNAATTGNSTMREDKVRDLRDLKAAIKRMQSRYSVSRKVEDERRAKEDANPRWRIKDVLWRTGDVTEKYAYGKSRTADARARTLS